MIPETTNYVEDTTDIVFPTNVGLTVFRLLTDFVCLYNYEF
jgi:hypothetical protein